MGTTSNFHMLFSVQAWIQDLR